MQLFASFLDETIFMLNFDTDEVKSLRNLLYNHFGMNDSRIVRSEALARIKFPKEFNCGDY